MQNGIAGRLTSAALRRGRQPTTMIERGGSGSLRFILNWRNARTGMAAHRVTPKKKSRSALMRSGSAMAGQKARKTSSGSKRSKNCETKISARPARERNVLEFNAEGASSSHPGLHRYRSIGQPSPLQQKLTALYLFSFREDDSRLRSATRRCSTRMAGGVAAPGTDGPVNAGGRKSFVLGQSDSLLRSWLQSHGLQPTAT
jgi:hypothetical protein